MIYQIYKSKTPHLKFITTWGTYKSAYKSAYTSYITLAFDLAIHLEVTYNHLAFDLASPSFYSVSLSFT